MEPRHVGGYNAPMAEKQATPDKAGHKTQPGAAKSDDVRRSGGVRHLAGFLPRLTKAALGKRGFAEGGIVTDWAAIVGSELAATSLPERLSFAQGARRDGTLQVRVAGAFALELQHLESVVIERINGYFGYRAVARLKIRQGPVPRRRARPMIAALDPAAVRAVDLAVADIADPQLKAALAGFGRALHGRKP
jgi:hypothetical protein